MSIIYEALKKTQQNLVKPAKLAPEKKPVSKNRKRVRIGLGVVLAILIVAQLTMSWTRKKAPIQVAVAAKPTPKMLLTGVFVSEQERLAVINNKTVHEGDLIEDMQIEHIDFDGVQLKKGNQRFTLMR